MYYTIQGNCDGIWDESYVGDVTTKYTTREEAELDLQELRKCGQDFEDSYQRGEIRIAEHSEVCNELNPPRQTATPDR